MIVLKDVLTPLEWRKTKYLLKKTKSIYGENDCALLKKMVFVVGYIHGLNGYITYNDFIEEAFYKINTEKLSPVFTLHFYNRRMIDNFFGVSKKFICESSLNEVRDIMANKREEMLKVQEIQHFPF